MRLLTLIFRVFLFLAVFAFATNNLHPATVNWFFSYAWTAPLVIIVLIAFACGAAVGVLAMMPTWWHHRRLAKRIDAPASSPAATVPAPAPAPDLTVVRDGL